METEEKQVIAYVVITPDETELVSKYRHDYVTYTDKNGKEYMTDGGTDYHRYSDPGDEKTKCITTDSPFEEIRKYFFWGSRYDKDMNPIDLIFRPLKELETSHIEAILSTQHQVPEWRKNIFRKELLFRENI